jgi:hypothetical protein
MDVPQFITAGSTTDKIPVRISYRIIELFSDGLYSSPSKAVEELVSNAFDAGASNVHVILSPDRTAEGTVIVVIDDGEGMDGTGLKQHWVIPAWPQAHIGVDGIHARQVSRPSVTFCRPRSTTRRQTRRWRTYDIESDGERGHFEASREASKAFASIRIRYNTGRI